ncbi:hypothetical protein SELMODRAFT_416187 [Selaginella moellendorffii]|uniref:ODAD1 central coiled coil region domain-containing protein n=1 Tax=Selaginella moellendorffii TaxID=88036 RepID=D8RYC7_SELML|nr:hypothetical protein SELMODRAFT_416187 [Selaginella moellendorffii]
MNDSFEYTQLKDVHKKYRIIEGTRRIYHGESEGILRRQEATLANIRTDNQSLRENVDSYFIPNYELQMAQLHEDAAKFGELVEHEAKRLEELELAVEKSKADKLDYKKTQGGVHAARDRHRNALIHIQITENRIHKVLVDLNIVERQNRNLKRKMKEIREERELFDDIRLKLEKELQWKEKEMEKCIELSSLLYDERNDIEERFTDVLEMHGDMEAYKMWEASKGWAVMEPEPVENFLHVQPRSTEERKEPMDCSEYFRQWIDVKSISNIQDILGIDSVYGMVQAVKELQQKNVAIIARMNELVNIWDNSHFQEMDTIKALPKPFDLNIESAPIDPDAKKKVDMEAIMDKISSLLKELDFEDEEYILIINEMKKRVGKVFSEAGCAVDGNALTNEKGKARLEEALGQWYNTIDSFVDQLIKQAKESVQKK